MEKTAVCPDTAVLRDTIQITVCQDALFQRLKGDDSFAVFSGSLFQAVLFDCPVKDIIGILVQNEGAAQILKNPACFYHGLSVVIGKSGIESLSAFDSLVESAHAFFQGSLRVHPVVVENVHVIQIHPFQTLVQTGEQILAAAPVSVGTGPHIISGLGADEKLVPVRSQILFQNPAEIAFRAAGRRTVIIGQIKMGDALVKSREQKLFHIIKIARISEIVPQAQRDGRKLQAASSAAAVFHGIITGWCWLVHENSPFSVSHNQKFI